MDGSHEEKTEKASFGETVEYKGYWFGRSFLQGAMEIENKYTAKPGDVLLANCMKTGTAWLKPILYAIVNHGKHGLDMANVIKHTHPQMLFKEIEFPTMDIPDQVGSNLRLLHTHLPLTCLPPSVTAEDSECKIVYLARNPKDSFVSLYHFLCKCVQNPGSVYDKFPSMDTFFEDFCRGVVLYGPFVKHVKEYWYFSQAHPHRVMFLTYEDLQANFLTEVKRLAEFLGRLDISEEDIMRLGHVCSIGNVSTSVAENAVPGPPLPIRGGLQDPSIFFRKGEVGDWKNYFTPLMNEMMDSAVERALGDCPFRFTYELL